MDTLTWDGFTPNMVPVTLDNIVGGSIMVGFVFAVVYRRDVMSTGPATSDHDVEDHPSE